MSNINYEDKWNDDIAKKYMQKRKNIELELSNLSSLYDKELEIIQKKHNLESSSENENYVHHVQKIEILKGHNEFSLSEFYRPTDRFIYLDKVIFFPENSEIKCEFEAVKHGPCGEKI